MDAENEVTTLARTPPSGRRTTTREIPQFGALPALQGLARVLVGSFRVFLGRVLGCRLVAEIGCRVVATINGLSLSCALRDIGSFQIAAMTNHAEFSRH